VQSERRFIVNSYAPLNRSLAADISARWVASAELYFAGLLVGSGEVHQWIWFWFVFYSFSLFLSPVI